jgi:tRNA/tmRNA/rRNA uracil-C5-methylase (TrmA/RlmC/RlmD family)
VAGLRRDATRRAEEVDVVAGARGAATSRRRAARASGGSLAGRILELDIGPVAHGGMCVARHEGRVVFVRHTLPGERVRARVTEGRERDTFLRADAVEVLLASPDRVAAPCPFAGPGRCGGCDWQHADPAAQRRLKAAVVHEQLLRLAGLDLAVEVEAVEGAADGTGWRTRVRFAVDREGRAGLRGHRSHEIVPVDDCLIAHPGVAGTGVLGHLWPGVAEITVAVAAATGEQAVVLSPDASGTRPPDITEKAAGRSWEVPADGFWQVHPAAADVLVEAVLGALDPRPGESALDLYCGVGLFAGALAERLGPAGRVVAVEGAGAAVASARVNLADLAGVRVIGARVDRALAVGLEPTDLVVLDPPRTGAGRVVVDGVAALGPRRIAYVACDPAALARDIAYFAAVGYDLAGLRAFDLFPHTHHVECVATLVRGESR